MIVYVAFGICALLALGVALVVLFIPTLIINMFFGRECDIVRDSKGKLVSVKMPKSIIILVVVTYVVFALPYGSLFDTEKWFGTEQLGGCIFILACWSVFMLIPVCLHLGKNLARGVVAGICIMTIIIVVMVFFAGGEIGWRGWMIGIVSILVSRFVIALLLLPQSIEWFSAKKELSRASAGKTANVFYWICRKIGRLFGAVSPRQKTGREAPAGKAER